jgi:molybdopterin-guanine dinucleotide biosynthesis protein A
MMGLLGAVLCGGASTRMGTEKAAVLIGGVPMASRVADALRGAGCTPVVALGGAASLAAGLGLGHLADDHPGDGPLGGVLTALRHGGDAVVVVSCDVPGITAASLSRLVGSLGGHQAAIACTDRAEPLCAVWSQAAAPTLRSRFAAGERAMHRAIEGLDVVWVPVAEHELHNVNTPQDLGRL